MGDPQTGERLEWQRFSSRNGGPSPTSGTPAQWSCTRKISPKNTTTKTPVLAGAVLNPSSALQAGGPHPTHQSVCTSMEMPQANIGPHDSRPIPDPGPPSSQPISRQTPTPGYPGLLSQPPWDPTRISRTAQLWDTSQPAVSGTGPTH